MHMFVYKCNIFFEASKPKKSDEIRGSETLRFRIWNFKASALDRDDRDDRDMSGCDRKVQKIPWQ